jgi:LysR family hca operon transcriptional activator
LTKEDDIPSGNIGIPSPNGDLDLRYLRYFVVIAEELNITRAAERLHTVQPSLSQQIHRLEEIVGTPLFYRKKNHLELTEAGHIFLMESRSILRSASHAVTLARQAARAEAGKITIGFVPGPEGKVFPYVLPILQSKYPEIQLVLHSMTSAQQILALQKCEINLGFLRGPISDPRIVSSVLMREEIVAVLPAKEPLAKLERVPPAKLATLPYISPSSVQAPALHEHTNRVATQIGVAIRSRIGADSIWAGLNAVGSGAGFTLLPDYVYLIAPQTVRVVPLDMDPPPPAIELLLAYRSDDKLPALALFLSLLRDCMQQCEQAGHTPGTRYRINRPRVTSKGNSGLP